MGLLDNFERGLERVIGGAFARTFKSGLQPVEIAAALRRELDTKAAIVSRDRILVPNTFTVRLAPADHDRMQQLGQTLIDELTGIVQDHAAAQRYQFAGGITITLDTDPALTDGLVQIDSLSVKGAVTWSPVLDIGGKRYPLPRGRTVIGRGSESDITVSDTGISRRHVEIRWDGERAEVHDLGSTNGSLLNGQPLTRAPLSPDSEISIGRTRIVFRVLAQSTHAASHGDQPTSPPAKGGGGW